VAEHTELERDLQALEATLRRLELEYNQYFAGHLPRPPLDTRHRVEMLFRRFDRAYIQSAVDRFRLNTLQSRFSTFIDLWDRALRAREEGRPGPFFRGPKPVEAEREEVRPAERVVGAATMTDPAHDVEKIEALYDSLVAARKETGAEDSIPFHRFAQIVKTQVTKLQQSGTREVAFRVSIKDGKVAFTAKGLKGQSDPES
jgi:hypothetical protein